jgi:hypothetical protein
MTCRSCEQRRQVYLAAAARVTRSLLFLRAALFPKANFDPDQPRVPRGHPDGGRWTRIAGLSAKDRCIEKCYPLLERPEPRGTSLINSWAFHRCLNDCMASGGNVTEGRWTATSLAA